MRTGGEILVDGLLAHGIDTVFGLPGAQIYGFFDALHRAQPRLKVIGARHEQGCGYMAFGYARATGRASAFSVVPGPGMLNASAALLTAFGCNEPVLCLTGQVPLAFLDKGRGHLHEMPNQLAALRSFVKWAERTEHPATTSIVIRRAFQEMLSGRRGPAAIEMPWNVFTRKGPADDSAPLPLFPLPQVDLEQIDRAVKLIRESRAPMIFVGSGAIDAAPEVLELAERIEAPVVAFRSGRGIVSNAHALGLTMDAAYKLWPETDLMIGIGTRLELAGWRWPYRPRGLKSIRIDIDPAEMRRFTPGVQIIADSKDGTAALITAIRRSVMASKNRGAVIARARATAEGEIRSVQPQLAYLKVLRDVLPANGIVTDELSQVGFASWFGFPVYEPRTFISSGYQGTLGSGFPTALGAKVARPDTPVVAICGDGGFLFAVQELATAVQYRINLVTLVFNNESYANVRRDQQNNFDGRVIAADLQNPDFMKLAESFGVQGARVQSPSEFQPALEKALAAHQPALIEIIVPRDSEADPWPFIHPPKPEGIV